MLPHTTFSLGLLGSLELLDTCFMTEDDSSEFLIGLLMRSFGELLLLDVLLSRPLSLGIMLDDYWIDGFDQCALGTYQGVSSISML